MQISFCDWDNSARAHRAVLGLGRDEVQVWIASVPTAEAGLTALAHLLSTAERDRAARFKVREARDQFVFGRALLRQLLGACLRVEPAALEFGYQPHGKPFLTAPASNDNLRFNLSHSGSMVAVALARGRDVGVDIEWIEPPGDRTLLTERIFSTREFGELRALPKSQQWEAFFNGWTRKEAYLKATGEGLIDALPAIEVTLAPGNEPELRKLPTALGAVRQWAIRAIPLPPGYAGAVVFESRSLMVT
jgi:4'-phosphopantetheinyl transferase